MNKSLLRFRTHTLDSSHNPRGDVDGTGEISKGGLASAELQTQYHKERRVGEESLG
jgi:hypothetical protein